MILRARLYCSHDCRESGTLRAIRRRLAGGNRKSAATMGRYCRDAVNPRDREAFRERFAKPWVGHVRRKRLAFAAKGLCVLCGEPVREESFS